MMRAAVFAAALIPLAAGSLAARDITLSPPLACDLGADCFIQQYVDHDPSEGAMDFRCSNLSYDTHKGTDFALRSFDQMRRGVRVLASAPGTVTATRDGMQDTLYDRDNGDDVDGRECGNGVVLDHGGGWTTQYCHLKRGSVAVRKGDRVSKQTTLGLVGLSGRTQFPHVHLSVRKDGAVIDPFDPDGKISCDAPSTQSLWRSDLPYRPGGVLTVGFADAVPAYDAVKDGSAAQANLPTTAPAIVVFGYAFGGKKGDRMRLTINTPDGELMDEYVALDRDQAQFFRAVGKKRSVAAWPKGRYTGTVTLMRGGRMINSETTAIQVR
jgi:hypothetical protein